MLIGLTNQNMCWFPFGPFYCRMTKVTFFYVISPRKIVQTYFFERKRRSTSIYWVRNLIELYSNSKMDNVDKYDKYILMKIHDEKRKF